MNDTFTGPRKLALLTLAAVAQHGRPHARISVGTTSPSSAHLVNRATVSSAAAHWLIDNGYARPTRYETGWRLIELTDLGAATAAADRIGASA